MTPNELLGRDDGADRRRREPARGGIDGSAFLPSTRRDIFLDNQRDPSAIEKQFERLIKLAKKQHVAVAIGHPYPETLEFLEYVLPTLAHQGIKLSLASKVLNTSPLELDTDLLNCHR